MTTRSVQDFMDELRLLGDERFKLVDAVRKLVRKTAPSVSEEIKYGGILFCADVQFCGVFSYKQHVSVEFGSGARIADTLGHLEGAGKGRRHIKLHVLEDIEARQLAHYLPLALAAARNGG